MKFERLLNRFGLYSADQMKSEYGRGVREMHIEMDQVIGNIRSAHEKTIGNITRSNRETIDKIMRDHREEVEEMKANIVSFSDKLLKNEEETADAIHNEHEALKSLELARADVKNLGKECDRLKRENRKLADENAMLREAVDQGAAKLADSESECERLRDNVSNAAAALAEKRKDISDLKAELDDTAESLAQYREKASFLEADRDDWKAAAERYKAELEAAKANTKSPARRKRAE